MAVDRTPEEGPFPKEGGPPLESGRAWASELLSDSPGFHFSADRHGMIVHAAGRGLDTLHVDPASLVGTWIGDLIDNPAIMATLIARMLTSDPFDGRCTIGDVTFQVQTLPVKETGPGGVSFVGVALAMGRQIRQDFEERQIFQARIYEGERERMTAFRESLLELIQHEVRTPITPILISLHLLRTINPAKLEPLQARALDAVQRNLDRLIEVMEKTLPRAGQEPLPGRLPTADLRVVVETVVGTLGEHEVPPGVKIDHGELDSILVEARQDHLEIVLGMTLDLVLSHNGDGDTVHVRVRRRPHDGQLVVTNAKWAPTPSELETVLREDFFDTFDAVVAKAPQLLPLALVRATAEANNGRLQCLTPARGDPEMVLTFPIPSAHRSD